MDEVGEQGEGTCHYCLGKLRGRDLPNYPADAKIEDMGEFVEERTKLCTKKFAKIGSIRFRVLPTVKYYHLLNYFILMVQIRNPTLEPHTIADLIDSYNFGADVDGSTLLKALKKTKLIKDSVMSLPESLIPSMIPSRDPPTANVITPGDSSGEVIAPRIEGKSDGTEATGEVVIPPLPSVPTGRPMPANTPFPECWDTPCQKWFISEIKRGESIISRKVEATPRTVQYNEHNYLAWKNGAGLSFNVLKEKLEVRDVWKSDNIAFGDDERRLIGPFNSKLEAEEGLNLVNTSASMPIAPTTDPVPTPSPVVTPEERKDSVDDGPGPVPEPEIPTPSPQSCGRDGDPPCPDNLVCKDNACVPPASVGPPSDIPPPTIDPRGLPGDNVPPGTDPISVPVDEEVVEPVDPVVPVVPTPQVPVSGDEEKGGEGTKENISDDIIFGPDSKGKTFKKGESVATLRINKYEGNKFRTVALFGKITGYNNGEGEDDDECWLLKLDAPPILHDHVDGIVCTNNNLDINSDDFIDKLETTTEMYPTGVTGDYYYAFITKNTSEGNSEMASLRDKFEQKFGEGTGSEKKSESGPEDPDVRPTPSNVTPTTPEVPPPGGVVPPPPSCGNEGDLPCPTGTKCQDNTCVPDPSAPSPSPSPPSTVDSGTSGSGEKKDEDDPLPVLPPPGCGRDGDPPCPSGTKCQDNKCISDPSAPPLSPSGRNEAGWVGPDSGRPRPIGPVGDDDDNDDDDNERKEGTKEGPDGDQDMLNRINARRRGFQREGKKEDGSPPEAPAKSPVRYSQPFVISRWQVYPGPYQPGLRVYSSTGVDVPEWLRHLGQPNPRAQAGGKRKRKTKKRTRKNKKKSKKKNSSRKK